MARPKKNEGAKGAPPAPSGITTADGVSTTPEAPATVVQDETTGGTHPEGVAETAPTDPSALSADPIEQVVAEEVVPGSRGDDGTTIAVVLPPASAGIEPVMPLPEASTTVEVTPSPGPTPPMATSTADATAAEPEPPLGEKLAPRLPGIPGGIEPHELTEMGIPLPGAVLTCAAFEDGQPEQGVVTEISPELDVLHVWLRRGRCLWPIPTALIEGTTWTHREDAYPPLGMVSLFDSMFRAPSSPPSNAPAAWLDEEPVPVAAPVATLPTEPPAAPPAPEPAPPARSPFDIPEHYTLCKVLGLGSISGHGIRASDGRHLEHFDGGSLVYFPAATVRKLAELLEVQAEG